MGHARAPLPPPWSTLQGRMLDGLLSEPRRTFVELLEFDGEDLRGRLLTAPKRGSGVAAVRRTWGYCPQCPQRGRGAIVYKHACALG